MSKILDRKQLVLDAMDNKPVERVPAGFWFHFLADEIHSNAFEQPELTEQVLAGEIKYIEESQSDFVKIMTDGFFPYTSESFLAAKTSEDLKHLQPPPKDDKWFTYQVAYAKKLTDKYGDKIATFYNLFCPCTIIKFMQPNLEDGEPYLANLVRQDKEAVKAAFDVISDDLAELARRVINEAHVTGVILGADCTVPRDTPREHFQWVREALEEYKA